MLIRPLNRVVFFFVLGIKEIRNKGIKRMILLEIKERMRIEILLEIKREIKDIME